MTPAEVARLHEAAARLREQADAAAHARDAAVAAVLDAGGASGIELAASMGLSTQRVYDMANRARRRYAEGAPRERG